MGLEFACEKDAHAAADHWANNPPCYRYTQFTIVPASRKVEMKRGRPRKDEERLTIFSIQAEITRNSKVILPEKENWEGSFWLQMTSRWTLRQCWIITKIRVRWRRDSSSSKTRASEFPKCI